MLQEEVIFYGALVALIVIFTIAPPGWLPSVESMESKKKDPDKESLR